MNFSSQLSGDHLLDNCFVCFSDLPFLHHLLLNPHLIALNVGQVLIAISSRVRVVSFRVVSVGRRYEK